MAYIAYFFGLLYGIYALKSMQLHNKLRFVLQSIVTRFGTLIIQTTTKCSKNIFYYNSSIRDALSMPPIQFEELNIWKPPIRCIWLMETVLRNRCYSISLWVDG